MTRRAPPHHFRLVRRIHGQVLPGGQDHPSLKSGEDFEVDERTAPHHQGSGGDEVRKTAGLENMYDPANMDYIHYVYQA